MKAEGIKPNYSALGKIYDMDRRTVKKEYLGIENQKEKNKRISKSKTKVILIYDNIFNL